MNCSGTNFGERLSQRMHGRLSQGQFQMNKDIDSEFKGIIYIHGEREREKMERGSRKQAGANATPK